MYRFLQKHGKKILAVFSAFLMASFALTGYYGQGSTRNPVVARVAGEKVKNDEVMSARAAWELLGKLSDPQDPYRRPLTYMLGPDAVDQINKHPIMFMLLQHEARQMGVALNEDFFNNLYKNTPWLETGNPERDEEIRHSLAQLMLVRSAAARAASPIKVTQPMVEHELAELGQTINANVVEFTTAQYANQVAAPTADELKAHFEKYGDVTRSQGDASNPFGFGYRYPDRLKLQYIGVRRDDVRKAVEATKDPYQWEVEAQKFYRQNQETFVRRDPPGSQPATRASSQPTTAPFTEVRQQVKDTLINQATNRKMSEVVDRITAMTAPDWVAYHKAAGGATRPTTAPSTAVGAPYDSFEYLQKVAQRVQQQTGVLPIVVSIADRWLTEADINTLPGLKDATLEQMPLATFLSNRAAGFIAAEKRNEPGVLAELEPTRTAYDAGGNAYITRVTSSEAAHRPATLAEVENEVRNDVAFTKSYALAKADAQKLLSAAASAGGLKSAAAGKTVVSVGPLSLGQNAQAVPGVAITGPSANQFMREAFKLVSAATTQSAGKSTRLIELAKDGRVFVAELADVQAMWNDRSLPLAEAQAANGLSRELEGRFHREWFDFDNVKSRLDFEAEDPSVEQ